MRNARFELATFRLWDWRAADCANPAYLSTSHSLSFLCSYLSEKQSTPQFQSLQKRFRYNLVLRWICSHPKWKKHQRILSDCGRTGRRCTVSWNRSTAKFAITKAWLMRNQLQSRKLCHYNNRFSRSSSKTLKYCFSPITSPMRATRTTLSGKS